MSMLKTNQFEPLSGSESDWWKKQRVLVTGASGFKGSWLCSVLAELGAEIHGTVANSINPESACELLGLRNKIVQYSVDLSDRQQVSDMVSSVMPSVIFHLGAKAIVRECLRDPVRAFDANAMGTLHVLEACRQHKINCQRLLICSTDHVFGAIDEGEIPIPERCKPRYGGPYETSKAVAELIAQCYYKTYIKDFGDDFRMCITRAANVFGFGDTQASRIIPRQMRLLSEHIQSGKGYLEYQYQDNGRQFLHVADAVSGYILAVSRLDRIDPEQQDLPTFHFCIESYGRYARDKESFIRLREIVELIVDVANKSPDITIPVECKPHKDLKGYVPNENPVQGLSCEDTKGQLNWSPDYDLKQGLEELLQWYISKPTRKERIDLIKKAVERCARRLRGSKVRHTP